VKKNTYGVFLWPDTHAPYHDPIAVAVALKALKTLRPKRLVILGDFWDFYAVSFYSKDVKRKALLADEIDEASEVAERVDAVAHDIGCDVDFTCGNHEHRLDRYVREKAPALTGLVRTMKEIIPAGWDFHGYGTELRIGKMLISHDFGRAGDNAGRQGLVDVGANISFGHTHQLGVSYLGQQRGDAHVALSCGWLGGLKHIDYRHQAVARRRYMHGFGWVRVDSRGNAWAQAIPIIGRSCVVDGKRISI
jgi:hypothetical protein